MNINKSLQNIRLGWSPFVVIAVTTLAAIAVSIYCLSHGWVIIFQNLFYVPIIIACLYYTKKGFAFSVVLSFIYLFLIISFTRDSTVTIEALIRVFVFMGVAGFTAFLSIMRKRREEARCLLAAIVEGSDDAIFSKDLGGHILSWNKAAEHMYGYEAKEIVGKHISLLCPPEEKDAHNRVIEQIERNKKVSRFETERVRKDGSRVWVSLSVSPLRDLRGAISGASIIARDISERKKAEEQLKAMTLDLKRKTELLEISNKELEAFSYSVSHDLRAPLRSIDGYSKVLLEDYSDKLDEQGRSYLDRVCAATQQMTQLIEDMLMLSRINRSGMRRRQVDLSALAKSITDEFMQNEPHRKAEFVIAPSIVVNGDEQLLSIMLHNLLGNAWKFTGKHPSARIELGVTKNGDTTYFVADDGAGFEMKYADRLFGAFQRLHTVEEFKGTGVGLAIVQRIVSRHGGKVWAQGEVEKGATFYFTLN